MTGATPSREFAPDAAELREMSTWWREWAREADLPADVLDRGELCLNEAAGNVIQHGDAPSPMKISFARAGDSAWITVIDTGRPFNPLEQPLRDLPGSLEDARIGGYGIPLLRAFSTGLDYRRDDDRNVLTLTFRW